MTAGPIDTLDSHGTRRSSLYLSHQYDKAALPNTIMSHDSRRTQLIRELHALSHG
jgi:hypothetical protein